MSEFQPKTLCVLGRQPQLGLAELERLYGAEHVRPIVGAALLDIEAGEINFKRLGGTLKVAKLLTILPSADWKSAYDYLAENIPKHLKYLPEGKFTLGVSVYGPTFDIRKLNADLLSLKKVIRASGRSVRIVPNKTLELNSAQVLHNKLTTKGGWELLLVRHDGRFYLAQTLFVQDIEAYGARDQARPKRDARVGMLPPKLAQIMINLAKPPDLGTVWDPFCGTGVLLQEALLMEYDVIGTDIDKRMIDYAKDNLDWLYEKYDVSKNGKLSMEYKLEVADAITYAPKENFDAVVSETYLGRPLTRVPSPDELNKIIQDVNTILKKFLNNLAGQVKKGTPICLAVPAWQIEPGKFKHLPIIDQITDMGYNYLDLKHVQRQKLLYFREGQTVARQLVVLTKA